MGDNPTAEESKSEAEIDPTLDITSELFDPLKALYAENVIIPYKNAKVYDNISKYESSVLRPKSKTSGNEATSQQSTNSILSNTRTSRGKFGASDEPVVRRFLPHQRKAFCVNTKLKYKNIICDLLQKWSRDTRK